ncbi:hypothetical protein CNR22_19730 [Sphingobacteriaceae bacterium]|nr:hypothetical protein CNR22_19730 [Sphingobacteriaceae bacterium]
MKKHLSTLLVGLGIGATSMAQTTLTGPSTAHTPYMLPVVPGSTMTSILTVTETVSGYMLAGLGDGLGAYDNGGGTFTLLMNHEMGTAVGAVHAHGQTGAFVSKWVINKSNLSVVSGADLIQNVYLWTGTTYTMYNSANTSTLTQFGRFCAADLPAVTAFYNSATGKGTQERIFMNGEESGNEGRAFAHISTGPAAGNTYELPHLGKFSWENSVASPLAQDKTIVAGMDDTTPGQVYIYVGSKATTGTDIAKAGLTGGKLYGVSVVGLVNEQSTSTPTAGTPFNLVDMGVVHNITGATLNTNSNNAGVTNFLRPEDGAWDPNNPRDFYFVTTNSFAAPSRMWRLRFNDINNPELGGTITAVLDGTEGQKMADNMVMDNHGHIMIQEDPGGQTHTAKIWQYKISTDALTLVADQDPNRFTTTGTNSLTIDEESSGIIDMQGILGAGWFILFDQAHYSIPGPAVDGGQLLAFYNPATAAANPEINLQGNATSIPSGNTAISAGDNTNFGSSNLNTPITKTFVIQNTNSGTLIVSALSMSGTNAGDFVITNAPSFPYSIAPNGSYSITVQFNPALLGVRNGIINVTSSDYDEHLYTFAIQGNGVAPEINLEGNSAVITDGSTSTSQTNNTDFGTVIYNMMVTKTFEIKNTGTGTLSVSGINISGSGSSFFTLLNAPAFPLNIAASASQTFEVQYQPMVVANHTANVSIMSNDADETLYDYKISGQGAMDVGINNIERTNSFVTLFPNPAKDDATLKFTLENNAHVVITVTDIQGKEVLASQTKDLEKGEREIILNTTHLKNGNYFVKINTGSKANTIKMIINH